MTIRIDTIVPRDRIDHRRAHVSHNRLNLGDRVNIRRPTPAGEHAVALTIALNPDGIELFHANVPTAYQPEERQLSDELTRWDLGTQATDFGPNSEIKSLFLSPTILEGRLFGFRDFSEYGDLHHKLGLVVVYSSVNDPGESLLAVEMPRQPYGDLESLQIELIQESPPPILQTSYPIQ